MDEMREFEKMREFQIRNLKEESDCEKKWEKSKVFVEKEGGVELKRI